MRRVRSVLAPWRQRLEVAQRTMLMAGFRYAVRMARMLHVLPPAARAGDAERILVVHLTPHLGDTILLMPMLEAVRKANPAARLEIAVEAAAAPLMRQVRGVDAVYGLKLGGAPPVTPGQAMRRVWAVTREYWRTMRGVRPTVAVNPRWDNDLFRSSVLAVLTGAPRRVGFASAMAQPAAYRDKLLTEPVVGGNGMHEAERFALAAQKAGLLPEGEPGYLVREPVAAVREIAASVEYAGLRERLGLPEDGFAVIAPGASMARRMWPVADWAAVAEALLEDGMPVVLLAGASDAGVARALRDAVAGPVTLVAGATSLVESVAVMARAGVFLGSDSGPGHVAGALGIRTVTLFVTPMGADADGPSSAERIHPLGPEVRCLTPPYCLPPCERTCVADGPHCITLIRPKDVLAAMKA